MAISPEARDRWPSLGVRGPSKALVVEGEGLCEHAVLHFNVTRELTSDAQLVCGLPHGGLQRSCAVFRGLVDSCAVRCGRVSGRVRGFLRSYAVECGRAAVVCGPVPVVCGRVRSRVRSRAVENRSY